MSWNPTSSVEAFPDEDFTVRMAIRYLRHAESMQRRDYYLCQMAYNRQVNKSQRDDLLDDLLVIVSALEILSRAIIEVQKEDIAKLRNEMAVRDMIVRDAI